MNGACKPCIVRRQRPQDRQPSSLHGPEPELPTLPRALCRYAGFEGDYTQYPSAEEAGTFLRAYLAAEAGITPSKVSAEAVADATAEANLFALASHQYWGAWCFLQAQWSLLDFDYLEYARVRWGECAARSDAFLEAAARRFPVRTAA